MPDCLSHSCPTCEGTGMDGSTYVPATHLVPSEVEPCPDCRGTGYPREAVERAAKAGMAAYDQITDQAQIDRIWRGMKDDPGVGIEDEIRSALAVIRAFHNEGTE